ncbi:GTPase [Thalassobaculum fulvum]|uniref:GTPase n=1 Tax=Thalassobaculum fulvum TaxID=1633335 RepID=A0A919CQJ6_9PROT|nr:GTP-binding protein [Thalassobaculum fulvum]GHD55260.1 GTPase [Thalassobaculum fulvum]
MTAPAPTPVTVLAGFLGAGKTTLLKRILEDPRGVRYGVLVNDFGAINIDAELVVETGADQVSLANGCVCCTIRDDMVEAIDRLLGQDPVPEHLLIETSGVSRPIAVVDALLDPTLDGRVAIAGVFCLVDTAGFRDLDFASTELAIEQACSADMVVLNKTDIASAADLELVESTLRGPTPSIRFLPTRFSEVPREVLFGIERAPAERPAAGHQHGHHHDHDHDHDHHHHDHGEEFQAWSWRSAAPLDRAAFRGAVRRLPASLLRMKGVLAFADGPDQRAVFQMVGKRHTLETSDGPAPAESMLVAIARTGELDGDALTALLDGCAASG